jgi:hypothetical protein
VSKFAQKLKAKSYSALNLLDYIKVLQIIKKTAPDVPENLNEIKRIFK